MLNQLKRRSDKMVLELENKEEKEEEQEAKEEDESE